MAVQKVTPIDAEAKESHEAKRLPTKAANAVRAIAREASKANKEAMKRLLRAQAAGDAEAVAAAAWEAFERSEFTFEAAIQLLAGEYTDMDETLMNLKKWETERKAGTKP